MDEYLNIEQPFDDFFRKVKLSLAKLDRHITRGTRVSQIGKSHY